MKSKWVIHKLNSHVTSWISSPFKTQIYTSQTSKTSTFILNHVDTSLLLSICGKEGYFHLGTSIHASIIKNSELHNPLNHISFRNPLVIWNSLISMYSKNGALDDSMKVFDEVPMRDTVSWNTLVSGFLRNGDFDKGFVLFKKMLKLGFYELDSASFTTVLSACDRPELGFVIKSMHCLVILNGFEEEVTVGNALITAYFKCGCSSLAKQVFVEMVERNVITWTAVISGSAQNELYEDSLRLFSEMIRGFVEPNYLTYLSLLTACSGLQALKEGRQIHARVWKLGIQSDLCIESALMDMYLKCGRVEDAWRIFETVSELDEVSVTVILVGLAQNCMEEEAIQFFLRILKAGIQIDPNIVSAVLGVFGVDTSLGLGKQIHSLVIKRSFGSNPFVGNGLINMYSKCGDLNDSIKVFSRMPKPNNVSWNSLIAAFARHGNALGALQLFEEMRLKAVEPTDITFLSVLHACSHVGLVDKGIQHLNSMTELYKITPRTEHYACVVDMLGRAGLLKEARAFIRRLPVKPDELIWQALLGASSFHGDTEIGTYAAEQLFSSAPETRSAAPFVLLANIYSSRGKWKERAMTIKRMKEKKVTKETGISWIEIDKRKHSFVVQDKMHPQADIIYGILKELFRHMVDEGYVPDERFILYYLDQDENDV